MNGFEELSKVFVGVAVMIQLLQMPFMVWFGRRMDVAAMLEGLPPLAKSFVLLFAQGIVLCVTGLGIVLLFNLQDVGGTRLGVDLVRFLVVFSLFRFGRQLALGRLWPANESKVPHLLLLGVHGSIMVLYTGAWLLLERRVG